MSIFYIKITIFEEKHYIFVGSFDIIIDGNYFFNDSFILAWGLNNYKLDIPFFITWR